MTPERIAELLGEAKDRLEGVLPTQKWQNHQNMVIFAGLAGAPFVCHLAGELDERKLRDQLLDVIAFAMSWIEIDQLGEGAEPHPKEKTR